MVFLRYFIIGILGACGGLLGNLLAAIVQQSLGRFTPFQAIAMVGGIVIVILLAYQFEERWNHYGKEIEQINEEIISLRQALYRLQNKHKSGAAWTTSDIEQWQIKQRTIAELKRQLRKKNALYTDEPIDSAPPPPLGCLIRSATIAKQISILFVFPMVLAFSLAFYGSPVSQTIYMASRPSINATPVSTVIAAIMATNTAEAQATFTFLSLILTNA
jgi:hypothetical protein